MKAVVSLTPEKNLAESVVAREAVEVEIVPFEYSAERRRSDHQARSRNGYLTPCLSPLCLLMIVPRHLADVPRYLTANSSTPPSDSWPVFSRYSSSQGVLLAGIGGGGFGLAPRDLVVVDQRVAAARR